MFIKKKMYHFIRNQRLNLTMNDFEEGKLFMRGKKINL